MNNYWKNYKILISKKNNKLIMKMILAHNRQLKKKLKKN